MAIPIPPPIHRAAQPRLRPVRLSVWTNVTSIRAPDAPNGCPRAIDPPLTLTFSRSIPSSLITATDWAA